MARRHFLDKQRVAAALALEQIGIETPSTAGSLDFVRRS
jgi:hypothetical protein